MVIIMQKSRQMAGLVVLFAVVGAVLAACGGSAAGGDPAQAIENYLRTRVTGDADKLIPLVCKAREGDARDEALSFGGLSASIKTLSCKQDGTSGEFTVVACQGEMSTVYAGETRAIDLGARKYRAILEDNAWRMCGYQ